MVVQPSLPGHPKSNPGPCSARGNDGREFHNERCWRTNLGAVYSYEANLEWLLPPTLAALLNQALCLLEVIARARKVKCDARWSTAKIEQLEG